ncbi:UDP-N-acetylglucosamine 1-carboxyvinyltransferase [Candidatus Acetothermia bacterium]|nr:UDP-N-acetylglucosamine 1-carboxyvinyltransferase [Candidatus Acetothermia bacterium]MBI3660789.1 UDP-N-acetylglucosamine 1-carboxyvinyltransferase [Candidatus Acetothermia bacterium]
MKIFIEGGRRLKGEAQAGGAKNSALPLLAATLLTDDEVILRQIPNVEDVRTMLKMLERLGKSIVALDHTTYSIRSHGKLCSTAPFELVKKMRASFVVLGPLLVRLGQAEVPLPGGCVIGQRPVDFHLKGLQALGARAELINGVVHAQAEKLSPTEIYLDFPSVGATEQLMMTAALIPGLTTIHNPAHEPEVYDLANLLMKMGAGVTIEPTKFIMEGVDKLKGTDHEIIPDRMTAGTYLVAGAITHSEIFVRCHPAHLEPVLSKMREMGLEFQANSEGVQLWGQPYRSVELETRPYPGFPTDLQPQMTALLALASGESLVKETLFENRFSHVPELVRMSANIRVVGNTALVKGVDHLEGTAVQATDIRAGAALVLAGLAARGTTTVVDPGYIARGYENLPSELRKLGAAIMIEDDKGGET